MDSRRLKIKICGMGDPDNCKEIAKLKPDYMGFIRYPESPRYVSEIPLNVIDMLREKGIEPVAVFVNETVRKIIETAARFGISHVQLHGTESPETCMELKESGLIVMKALSIAEKTDLKITSVYEDVCDYFLFDTKVSCFGGSGKSFDWKLLKNYDGEKPFFLSGGIGPDSAIDILKLEHPALTGIDVNSRFETKPGVKDFSLLNSFIQQLNM